MLHVLLLAPVLSAVTGPAQERTAIVGATVHTMVAGEEAAPRTLLIEGDRLRLLAPDAELAPGTRRIDVAGQHVVPGLIDAYAHFDRAHDALYTAAGVTTVRDVGGDRLRLVLERERARRDRVPGPTLLTAGALVGGEPPVTQQAVSLRNEHAAEEYLPILFEDGIDFLSIHPSLSAAAWKATIELAHENGLSVWGPVPGGKTLAEAVAGGQDGFHFLDGLLPEGVPWEIVQPAAFEPSIKALVEGATPLVPLLVVGATRLENQGSSEERLRMLELLDPNYEGWWKAELVSRVEQMNDSTAARAQRGFQKQLELFTRLAAAGAKLLPGTASGQPWLFPGLALHRELGLWVRAGLAPEEVLRRATRGAAEVLGIEGERGALFDGAAADFVCVAEDPREDLSVLVEPTLVCVRGRVVERRDIDDLLQTLAAEMGAARDELEKPLEIAAPPGPRAPGEPGSTGAPAEGDALVLEGLVETGALGRRLSGERFRVWRLADGRTAYCGRILYPSQDPAEVRELEVVQVVKDGLLDQSYVGLGHGDLRVEARGTWVARTWRMSTKLNGRPLVDTTSVHVRPRFVDVSSVTSLLILGQSEVGREIPVVHLREGLEGELVNWACELDDNGDHQVSTPLGPLAFRLNEHGAPERVVQRRGGGLLQAELRSHETFGGAGLPLPEAKRRAREAAAEAQVESEEPAGAAGAGD